MARTPGLTFFRLAADGCRVTAVCVTIHTMKATAKKIVLLSLALWLAAPALQAQEKAVLPYSLVAKYLVMFQSLESLDRVVPGMMVVSTNPGVAPQNIQFRVLTDDGWQTFNPDESGNIQIPYRPEWTDLVLVSNQPKGTLQLGVGFSARPPATTQTTYQDLMALVPQFEEALDALAKMQGSQAPKVKGLTVQMPEGSNASVHIQSKKGQQNLKAYATGIVVIKFDEALFQENPAVEFDVLPIGIVPLL